MRLNHFTPDEFRCHCGVCGLVGFDVMNAELLHKLDAARGQAGIPFTITSSIRCPAWNAKVGGVDSSAHVGGFAVDIAATSSRKRFAIISALLDAGFTRIGVAGNFVHADCDPDKPDDVLWTY